MSHTRVAYAVRKDDGTIIHCHARETAHYIADHQGGTAVYHEVHVTDWTPTERTHA